MPQKAVAEVPVDILPKGSTSREILDAKAAIRFAEEYHALRSSWKEIYQVVAATFLSWLFAFLVYCLTRWCWPNVGLLNQLSLTANTFVLFSCAMYTIDFVLFSFVGVIGISTALSILRLWSSKNAGTRRFRWVCNCGTSIYDAYAECDPGEAGRLQSGPDSLRSLADASLLNWARADLDRSFYGRFYQCAFEIPPEVRQHLANYTRQTVGGSNTPLVNINGFWEGVKFLFRGSNRNNESLPHHNPRPTPSDTNDNTSGTPPQPKKDPQYLLLCAPNSQHTTELIQIDTSTPPPSDKAFFKLLRDAYNIRPGRLSRVISLRSVSEIRFVNFELFHSSLVDVQAYDCIPPESERGHYVYRPMPAYFVPPVGKNLMKHLFEHPDHAGDLPVCFARVPRKLRERLSIKAQAGRNEGWGICFVEGVSWSRLCAFGLVGVVVSSVFGVVWTVVKGDVQGGFGVASYLLAVLVLGLGALQGALGV